MPKEKKEDILAFLTRMRSNLDRDMSPAMKQEMELPDDAKENRQTTSNSDSHRITRKRAISEATSDQEDLPAPVKCAYEPSPPPATRRHQARKDTAGYVVLANRVQFFRFTQNIRDIERSYNA